MRFRQRGVLVSSSYDECRVLLLSAFFCLRGQKKSDVGLRNSIEIILVELAKAEICVDETNVVQLFPEIQRSPP